MLFRSHNSFGEVGGLTVVDRDSAGTPATLAGIVLIDDGGFMSVPEPTTLLVLASGLLGLLGLRRRR